MARKDWVWMGRPAHFFCAHSCQFRLATYIPRSGVIVSTVGDMRQNADGRLDAYGEAKEIGCGRKYETFVFKGHRVTDCDGCEYHIDSGSEIDTLPANTANDATKNHYAMCAKWDKKKAPTPDAGEAK
jgi:hypothetical protein